MTRIVGEPFSGLDGFSARTVDEPAARELSQAGSSRESYDNKPEWQRI